MSQVTALERFQRHINTLSLMERNHYIAGDSRREDNAAHSLSVVMLAWKLHELTNSQLSLEKIMQYAAIHDYVEVYAGDVNTFASSEARQRKQQAEQAAIAKISAEYADSPGFVDALHAYENRIDEESRFVYIVDKIQALLQGKMDDWRCYYELGITDAIFHSKLDDYRTKLPEDLIDFYETFSLECRASYDYDPKQYDKTRADSVLY